MQERDLKPEIEIISTTENYGDGDANEAEKKKNLTLAELLALPHPLEQEENSDVLEIIQHYFPEKNYAEKLIGAIKPGISDNPDELENWEAEVILRRKQRISGEPALEYLVRLLYEETFSVRQFHGENFGVEGMTPGGLLSHFTLLGTVDGISIESVAQLALTKATFQEEFEKIVEKSDYELLRTLLTLVTNIAFPSQYYYPAYAVDMKNMLLRTKTYKKNKILENIGYRFVRIFHDHQQLLEKKQDEELKNICGVHTDQNLVMFLHFLWKRLRNAPGVFFTQDGYYKHEINQELIDGLEKLIRFRVHPDAQILFKYLSPSGYINENNRIGYSLNTGAVPASSTTGSSLETSTV